MLSKKSLFGGGLYFSNTAVLFICSLRAYSKTSDNTQVIGRFFIRGGNE